jgi:hypothetical protein
VSAIVQLVIAGSRTVSPTIEEIDRAVENLVIDVYGARPGDFAEHGRGTYVLEVICGDAAGADSAGEQWARSRGIPIHHEPITPADIAQHGKYAGPRMRNRRMAERGTHAIIFWDGVSAGSADMCTRMVARNKPVGVVPCKPRAKRTRTTR